VPDGDISKVLATKDLESPHIVAFTNGNQLTGVFVVGDSVYTEVQHQTGIMGAAASIICLYYILDLSYPRPYSMILAFFQELVMEEPYKHLTSKGFKTFQKQVHAALKKLPSDS